MAASMADGAVCVLEALRSESCCRSAVFSSLSLLQVHPVLSGVHSQQEHLHTRQQVSFCTDLTAKLDKREGGECITFSW